jgi:hypothetical protein
MKNQANITLVMVCVIVTAPKGESLIFPNVFPLVGIEDLEMSCNFGIGFKGSNLIQIDHFLDH